MKYKVLRRTRPDRRKFKRIKGSAGRRVALKGCNSCRHILGKITMEEAEVNRRTMGDEAYAQHCYMFQFEPMDVICPKYLSNKHINDIDT